MKKVALLIASLGMMSGVAVAHHGGSHQGKALAKADSGFRFVVGTPNGKVKKASEGNCHSHGDLTHCHD